MKPVIQTSPPVPHLAPIALQEEPARLREAAAAAAAIEVHLGRLRDYAARTDAGDRATAVQPPWPESELPVRIVPRRDR